MLSPNSSGKHTPTARPGPVSLALGGLALAGMIGASGAAPLLAASPSIALTAQDTALPGHPATAPSGWLTATDGSNDSSGSGSGGSKTTGSSKHQTSASSSSGTAGKSSHPMTQPTTQSTSSGDKKQKSGVADPELASTGGSQRQPASSGGGSSASGGGLLGGLLADISSGFPSLLNSIFGLVKSVVTSATSGGGGGGTTSKQAAGTPAQPDSQDGKKADKAQQQSASPSGDKMSKGAQRAQHDMDKAAGVHDKDRNEANPAAVTKAASKTKKDESSTTDAYSAIARKVQEAAMANVRALNKNSKALDRNSHALDRHSEDLEASEKKAAANAPSTPDPARVGKS
jgi:hypothetical protein